MHMKGEWYKSNMCITSVKVTRNAQHEEFDPDNQFLKNNIVNR